jgi:hypothetical protein
VGGLGAKSDCKSTKLRCADGLVVRGNRYA